MLMLSGQPAPSTLGCSRESCLALLESLPKPNKQQHAAQRHKEWNQLSHRRPRSSSPALFWCIFERCAISVPALKKTYKSTRDPQLYEKWPRPFH
jgi:hypothetical protein